MAKKVLIKDEELKAIELAKVEIQSVLDKYNVIIRGTYIDYSDDDSDYYYDRTTDALKFYSKDYENRVASHEKSEKIKAKLKYLSGLERFRANTMKNFPNHLNLEVIQIPSVADRKINIEYCKRYTSTSIKNLVVKDIKKVNELFSWNPNEYRQYNIKSDRIKVGISISVHTQVNNEITIFSHPGSIKNGFYVDRRDNLYDIESQRLLIIAIDRLIELGVFELINKKEEVDL